MKNNKKTQKKLKSKLDKIASNCQKKKYDKIPKNELMEAILLAEEINDTDEFRILYTYYKKYIPNDLLVRIEKIIGIKKEDTIKNETINKEIASQIVSQPVNKLADSVNSDNEFKTKSFDELPDETKELLKHYKEEGFLFKVSKAYRTYTTNHEEDLVMSVLEKKSLHTSNVYWANSTDLKIELDNIIETTTVLEAVKKYKDNTPIIMKLNRLLGLSIYTPADAYFEMDLENPKVKVLK